MTKVRTYRIDVDENARAWDAIVIANNGCMTSQHLGTSASLDNWTCPGNVPILDVEWKLGDSMMPSSTMKKCVYDPNGKNADVYDYCNFDNTPEIPVVNDPTVIFKQWWVVRGSISLNQASWWEIELMAGWVSSWRGTWINNNCIDVNVDGNGIDINSNNELCIVDYNVIKNWAACWASAIQAWDLCAVATSWQYCDLTGKPIIPTVIDNLCSTCTWEALSANQGRVLNARIDTVEARWRFLSNWNASTWLPVTNPEVLPYEYHRGDYFDVTVVWNTNYRPNWTSYTWVASTTVETESLAVWDTYVFDWTYWLLQLNHNITTTFASISWEPNDNANLSAALWEKADASSLCTVATTGCYDDLTGKPTIPDAQIQSDWAQTCNSCVDYIKNKPTLCRVATTASYNDLTDTPTIPITLTSGNGISISNNKINAVCDNTTIKVNSWNCLYADFTGLATTASLCAVATSWQYCDLTWKPNLATVATSGCYDDLNNKPDLSVYQTTANMVCALTNADDNHYPSAKAVADALSCAGAGDMLSSVYDPNNCATDVFNYNNMYNKPNLATVATSWCYCDLSWTPTIPTVNTKTFTLTNTSDTTNASAAAAYINDWNNAIILLSWQTYYLTSKSSSSMVFKSSVTSTSWTSDTELKQSTLTFTVSGNTVSAISNTATSLGKYLQTDRNYWTVYTPLYSWSPATKEYVDCAVWSINSAEWWNITGTMACQTDLQWALNCKADCTAIPTDNCQLANSCGYTTCTGTLVPSDLNCYAQCCDFISKTNTTEFTPTGDYNPATKLYVDTAVAWAGGGDMCYSDFNFVSKSWASVTLDLSSEITPSANFTVNTPSTIKEWQSYVLRVTNWATAYTMSLGSCVTNPWWVDLTLTSNGTDQFVFYAISDSELELQKEYDDENVFITQAQYNSLPSTKCTDGKTYFIYE